LPDWAASLVAEENRHVDDPEHEALNGGVEVECLAGDGREIGWEWR